MVMATLTAIIVPTQLPEEVCLGLQSEDKIGANKKMVCPYSPHNGGVV